MTVSIPPEGPNALKWLRLIVEAVPNALLLVDGAGVIRLVNKGTESLFGYSRTELIGSAVETLVPERFSSRHREHVRAFSSDPAARAMAPGREVFGRHRDGSEVPIEIDIQPLETPDGLMTAVSIVDLSERKRAAERFRLVVEAAPITILMVDEKRKITLVNRKGEELFGYRREELIGQPIELLVPERFRDGHPALVHGFVSSPTGGPVSLARALLGRHKDGRDLPVEIELNPIETLGGRFTLASIADVSERRKAEERFQLLVEAAPIAMLMANGEGVITLINRRAEELFGYTREELVGKPVEVLVPEQVRTKHAEHVRAFFRDPTAGSKSSGREFPGCRKDGSEVPLEIGLNTVETTEGKVLLASMIDITVRRRHEDELRRSNAELEQFAYIASHDLQEPLRMVASYTELLSQRYRGQLDEKADKYIFYAVDGAKRMQRLVADLLAYSRVGSQGKPLVPVACDAVLESVLQILDDVIVGAGATVQVGPLPVVLADEGQLVQVFQNLIVNALKFRQGASPQIRIEAARHGDRWVFSVTDNGIGIDMQYAERIFQMFQRLHERGKYDGSGIGLAITKAILERHGGRIWLESELGVGTTFFFTLFPPTGKPRP